MTRIAKPTVATMLLIAAIAGCQRDRSAAGTIDTTHLVLKAQDSAPLHPAPPASSDAWSSPVIVGFVATANDGEVQLGKLGVQKATNPEVKSFAHQMVTDHVAMLANTRGLAKRLGVSLDTGADVSRDAAEHARDELKDLAARASGKDWDEEFMDEMADAHEKMLNYLQDAARRTNDVNLRAALETAAGKVQAHLTMARDIKSRLD